MVVRVVPDKARYAGRMTDTDPPALLDVRHACEHIGIGRTSLYALTDAGALPSVSVGRR